MPKRVPTGHSVVILFYFQRFWFETVCFAIVVEGVNWIFTFWGGVSWLIRHARELEQA